MSCSSPPFNARHLKSCAYDFEGIEASGDRIEGVGGTSFWDVPAIHHFSHEKNWAQRNSICLRRHFEKRSFRWRKWPTSHSGRFQEHFSKDHLYHSHRYCLEM